HDIPRTGTFAFDSGYSVSRVQVPGRCLADGTMRRRRVSKESLVTPRTGDRAVREVCAVVVRLLDRRHEDLWMLSEPTCQGGSTALRSADDEKVGSSDAHVFGAISLRSSGT